MEAIVCQCCERVIEYIESEKVGTLYAQCSGCELENEQKENQFID